MPAQAKIKPVRAKLQVFPSSNDCLIFACRVIYYACLALLSWQAELGMMCFIMPGDGILQVRHNYAV